MSRLAQLELQLGRLDDLVVVPADPVAVLAQHGELVADRLRVTAADVARVRVLGDQLEREKTGRSSVHIRWMISTASRNEPIRSERSYHGNARSYAAYSGRPLGR